MKHNGLTKEYLHSLFEYKDGELFWKIKKSKNTIVGSKAGSYAPKNNIDVMLDGKVYKAHRLVFLMFNGYLPQEVDHIDGNPLNNKIENLRAATHAQNIRNAKLRVDNKSGEKGVVWDKIRARWRTTCVYQGKQYSAGYFKEISDAITAMRGLRESLHGDFARHQ